MPVFRRKPRDERLEDARRAFVAIAEELDGAQRGLLAAIPTARDPGIPLADAIGRFARGLDEVEALMPAWHVPGVDERWHACAEAIQQARREVERLRRDGPDLDFETLNARVGDVLEPLEIFVDVERDLGSRR